MYHEREFEIDGRWMGEEASSSFDCTPVVMLLRFVLGHEKEKLTGGRASLEDMARSASVRPLSKLNSLLPLSATEKPSATRAPRRCIIHTVVYTVCMRCDEKPLTLSNMAHHIILVPKIVNYRVGCITRFVPGGRLRPRRCFLCP